MERQTRRAALALLVTGIATFTALGVMTVGSGGIVRPANYPNDRGFAQAIYWFEMVRSGDEINRVLGDPGTDTGTRIRAAMDATNRVDFFFMTGYSLFFALLIIFLARLQPGWRVRGVRGLSAAGLLIAAVILASDNMETRRLLSLSAGLSPAALRETIPALMICSRTKFLFINIAALLAAFLYARAYGRGVTGILLPLLYGAAALTGIVALSAPPFEFLVEHSSTVVGIAWFASMIHAGRFLLTRAPRAASPGNPRNGTVSG